MRHSLSHQWLVIVLAASCFSHLLGCRKPVIETLLYELDRGQANGTLPPGVTEAELVDSLVGAMQSRLDGEGRVHLLPNGKIQVDLTGKFDPQQLDAMKRRMATPGVFEFRILASPVVAADQAIVEQAMALDPDEKAVVVDGKIVAKWVRGLDPKLGPADLFVARTAGIASEALALIDPLNVTGEYLTAAEKTAEQSSRLAGVQFTLNPQGAALLRQLTTANQPTAAGERHAIGLILDDEILAAPSLNAVISDQGIIDGMTTEEAETLIAILNAGILPLPIREAGKPTTR